MIVCQIQIGRGDASGDTQGMAQINAQLRAGGGDPFTVEIVSVGGEHSHIGAHEAQVVGNVSPYAAETHAYSAGVGIGGYQGGKAAPADIHVDTADDHRIGARMEDVPPTGDAALLGQIGNVYCHAGAGNAQLCGNVLL